MGEVYKARHTGPHRRHQSPPRTRRRRPQQRFAREAKTISSLNHPHICTLYGIGSQTLATGSGEAEIDFLVMELEGDTLAQRLEKSALPLD
jgi:serine/threonine protein kinase